MKKLILGAALAPPFSLHRLRMPTKLVGTPITFMRYPTCGLRNGRSTTAGQKTVKCARMSKWHGDSLVAGSAINGVLKMPCDGPYFVDWVDFWCSAVDRRIASSL